MRVLLSRITDLLRRTSRDRRLDEEIDLHLELLAEEFVARGLTREEARLAARRQFGGVDQMKVRYREQRGLPMLDALVQDLAFAWRLFARDRMVSLGIVGALALGIGSSVTVFTILNAMLLRDVPFFRDPDRVVAIDTLDARGRQGGTSLADLADWRGAGAFSGMSAYTGTSATLADETGPAERLNAVYVAAGTFELLGAAPVLGRTLFTADDRVGVPRAAVLSHELWVGRYGGAGDILGRSIRIDARPTTVIGIMPPGFTFPLTGQLWLPLAHLPGLRTDARDARTLGVVARLAGTVTLARARAELDAVAAGLSTQYPATNHGVRPVVVPFVQRYLGTFTTPEPLLLLTSALLLLLIACANASTLLLTRAAARTREIALRAAMGASRGRIMAQLLTESVGLAAVAGAVGVGLAAAAVRVFASTTANLGLPSWTRFEMDANVVAFVAVACLGTGIVFGCIPALHLSRRATPLALWDGGRRVGGGAGAGRFMRVLLGAQIAVAVVLLAGAVTLVGRSAALRRADQIVQPHAVLTARVALPADGFQPGAARGRFVAMLLDRLRAIPGVTAASAATTLPFIGAASATLEREGDLDANAGPSVCTIGASPGYFETLSLAFRAGRRPLAAERDVVVINEALAAIVGERGEVIGQRVRLRRPAAGISTPWLTVAGVVPSVRQTPMGDPRPCVYLPLELEPGLNLALLLRAGGDAASLAADLRRAFAAVAGDLALYNVSTLEEVSHNVRWAPRTVSMVLSIFGMVAFTLSMAGVYAVTASGVAQRTHELGVRLALGAARRHVVGLVAGRVAPSLAIGLLLGLAGGVGLRQMLRGVLIGQNGGSPASLVFIALAVLMVVAAACSVPLRRALGIDPARTLRAE